MYSLFPRRILKTPARAGMALLALLLFTGCTNQAKENTSNTLDAVGNETSASYDKIRNYLDVGHRPKAKSGKQAMPRYCYKTYEDVICYEKPIPGEEYRLVGFQTPGGNVGYVMEPPTVPGGGNGELPPLRKVDVTAPPAIKADKTVTDNAKMKEIIFDPAELEPRELVPDKPQ